MGDQHSCVVGNQTPVVFELASVARQIECPIEKPRLMRRAPKLHAIYLDPAVFEIHNVLKCAVRVFVALEDPVVISGDQQHAFEV